MNSNLKKVLALLSHRERVEMAWLFLAMLLMGLLEMVGVASIAPFTAVAANPELIQTNSMLHALWEVLQPESRNDFLFMLGVLVLAVLTFGNAFSALTNWLLLRFANMQGHELSRKLLVKYLGQPYLFFLNRNSAELSKNMFSEVGRVVVGVLTPLLRVMAVSIVAICITVLLVMTDPFLAVAIVVVLGGAYAAVFLVVRKKVSRIGEEATELSGKRYQAASEAFGSIKELKLSGRESLFIERYSEPSHQLARHNATSQAVSQLPRYLLETIAFGGVLLIMLYLLAVKGSLSEALPVIALYTFAGYRLMPAMQQLFSSMAMIRYNESALNLLYRDIADEEAAIASYEVASHTAMPFGESIEFRGVTFSYPQSGRYVLEGLDLQIRANSVVALVGSTGSGKTTILDMLLGLIRPDAGGLYIDGREVGQEGVRLWQRNLGYVPQSIYLTDDTIERNIAFGVAPDDVDHSRVEEAAKLACLHEFVMQELPDGYHTIVGEQGVKLSGGQRQRIGIARALYRDPKVLVLDEATSALDGMTEQRVMDGIASSGSGKTVIIVAHRLQTIQHSDVIHVLEKGSIVASGTYDELLRSCDRFRTMVHSSESKKNSVGVD
jgi:ABC-type multidrug transport system fused ATPase/permease subunit